MGGYSGHGVGTEPDVASVLAAQAAAKPTPGDYVVIGPSGNPVGLAPPPAVAPSFILAECNTPPASQVGPAGAVLAWDGFYDQAENSIGTGAPTDAAVIAALAAMGLTVNAGGTLFTVAAGGDGLFAIRVDVHTVGGGGNTNACMIWLRGVGGYVGWNSDGQTIPAATVSGEAGVSFTDALIAGNQFAAAIAGTAGETDLVYASMAIVRVR